MSIEAEIVEFENVINFEDDELLGVQIAFDDVRGQVWFPLNTGLTMVYGQNGSGKTQILNCLKRALSGVKADGDPGTELVFRAGENIFIRLVNNLFVHFRHERSALEQENAISNVFREFCEVLGYHQIDFEDKIFDSDDVTQFLQLINNNWLTLTKFYFLGAWLVHPHAGQISPSQHDLTVEQILLIRQLILEISESRIAILKPQGSVEQPAWFCTIGCDSKDGVTAVGQVTDKTVTAWSQWLFDNMGPNGEIRSESNHGEFLYAPGVDFLTGLFAKSMVYSGSLHTRFVAINFFIYIDELDNTNFLTEELDFEVLDLNQIHSISKKLTQAALNTSGELEVAEFLSMFNEDFFQLLREQNDRKVDWEFSDSEILLTHEFRPIWETRHSTINQRQIAQIFLALLESIPMLRTMNIHIKDILINPNITLSEIAKQDFFDVCVIDDRFPEKVLFTQLSDAQQRMIEIVLEIVLAEHKKRSQIIVIGDEIDRSMHENAVASLYKVLQSSQLPVIVATHSFQALVNTPCRKRHIELVENGITLKTVSSTDLDQTSEALGVTKSSLLGLTQLFVVVEGEHDQIVINELLKAESLLSDLRVQVLPMRGTENALRILDSRLFAYSAAKILVVVDNGLNNVIGERLTHAKELVRQKKTFQEVQTEIMRMTGREESNEEKTLTALIIDSAKQGMLARLNIYALSKGDIIEYLSPDVFGLGEAWEELREKYQEWRTQVFKGKKDFKFFLIKEYQASIDSSKIGLGATRLNMLHSDLVGLITEIQSLIQNSI